MDKEDIIDALSFAVGRTCDICGAEFRLDSVTDSRRICHSCSAKLRTILHDFDISKIRSAETNYNNIPEPCKTCRTHPFNGGSGICFCTLCTPKIT